MEKNNDGGSDESDEKMKDLDLSEKEGRPGFQLGMGTVCIGSQLDWIGGLARLEGYLPAELANL